MQIMRDLVGLGPSHVCFALCGYVADAVEAKHSGDDVGDGFRFGFHEAAVVRVFVVAGGDAGRSRESTVSRRAHRVSHHAQLKPFEVLPY